MKSTAEQLPIIEYQGDHLVVKAYAGCGKTTTLVAYANRYCHQASSVTTGYRAQLFAAVPECQNHDCVRADACKVVNE